MVDTPAPQAPRLYQRIVSVGFWTLGSYATFRVTRLLSSVIMTRLLFPSAFGQIAAITALLVGLNLITDVGVRTVVVQSALAREDDFLRTAWTLKVLRGTVIWLILVIICGLISIPNIRAALPAQSVYADPQFSVLTITMGLNLIIGDLESTAVQLNIKRLNPRPLYMLDLASEGARLPVMIGWAWISPSVWALVGGALAAGVVRSILSHVILTGPRMGFRWRKEYVREIVHFGKWINVASIASFIGAQSDRLILGFLLPSSIFGVYAIARMLIDTAQSLFDRLNANLTLPVLSEVISRDHRDLKDRFYRFRIPFDCAAPLLSGFLVLTGALVVHVLYDERYAEAGQMLQILAIGLLMYPALLMRTAFIASREPHIVAALATIQALAVISFLILGYLLAGLMGAVAGFAIYQVVPLAAILIMGRVREWVDFWKELRVVPIFATGMVIGELVLMAARAVHLG